MNAIYILWLRQIKRYFRSRSRMAGSLAQPLLFFVALGFGFGPIFERAGGGDYLQFLAPGIIAMSIMFSSIFTGIDLIWDRKFGFLKETLAAPVSRLNIMLGRTLGGATTSVIQGLLVLILTLFFGFHLKNLFLLPLALLFMLMIALFFTAAGTAIASLLEDMQAFPLIMNFLVMPLFFLSGALFPLENLPGSIRVISRVNPLTFGVDGLRIALSGQMTAGGFSDLAILAALILIALLFGGYLFKKIQV
jgi:ABC-2 type transport system permease protein